MEISLTLKACLFTLKHIRHNDFRERLPELFNIIRDIPFDDLMQRVLDRLLVYIYQCSDINIRKYKDYIRAAGSREVENIMITTYEQILREGEQIGRQEGRQEGKRESKIHTARRMLERGYPIQDVLEINELELEDLKLVGLV